MPKTCRCPPGVLLGSQIRAARPLEVVCAREDHATEASASGGLRQSDTSIHKVTPPVRQPLALEDKQRHLAVMVTTIYRLTSRWLTRLPSHSPAKLTETTQI